MNTEKTVSRDEEARNNWRRLRKMVLERDDYECQFCGVTDNEHRGEHDQGLHIHHIIPRGDGGEDHPENLITVCGGCHRTLEETHGRAIGRINDQEDYSDDLQGLTRVWRDRRETVDNLNDALSEWANNHPVFAKRFTVRNYSGDVAIHDLEPATVIGDSARLESEWDFAVAWGYHPYSDKQKNRVTAN